MLLAPEAQVLVINASVVLIAYFGIYPSFGGLTVRKMLAIDMVLSGLALFVAGALFWGSGERFSLVFVSTSWAVFSFLTMLAMEWPLHRWFCRRNGIDMSPGE